MISTDLLHSIGVWKVLAWNWNSIFGNLLCFFISCVLLQFVASEAIPDDTVHGPLATSKNESSKGWCRLGWHIHPNKNKCLKYIGKPLSWDESEAICIHNGGHLASVTSSQDLSFTRQLCGQIVNGCWVGGRGFNSTVGFDWKWSDNLSMWNESIFAASPFASNCSISSCSNNVAADFCTLVNNRTTNLVGERCNQSHAFICMLNLENKCYHMHCHREYLIILAIVSGLILCSTFAVVIWLLVYRRSKKRRKSHKLSNPASSALVPPSWKVFTTE